MDELKVLREAIDRVDDEILRLFEERMSIVKTIGVYKKESSLPIMNSQREEEVIAEKLSKCENKEIKKEVKELFNFIMKLSREYQERV